MTSVQLMQSLVIGGASTVCTLVFVLTVNHLRRVVTLSEWDIRFINWNLAFIAVAMWLVGVAE